ncbi:MAG TPA: HAMP domain-containing sensor histidine kinase [Dermatophilaceae bacterium]|nr:HAMP domain-containing sensor histidine kinase [Dermatophilaceae bacterium]
MPRGWLHPSAWTLRAKLVASMLALFTVLTIVTSAVSLVGLNQYLQGQTDQALRNSLQRFPADRSLPGGPVPDGDGDDRRGPGEEGLVVIVSGDTVWYRATAPGGGRTTITPSQVDTLEAAGLGRDPQDVDLGGVLGVHRVLASTRNGTTYYVGLSVARQQATVANAVRIALIAGLLGLTAMAAAGLWLVKRNLRPLNQVAQTATRVSQLHLASGEVALAERVPAAYTDPRTEVGTVGAALNGLLDHVQEALAARHQSEQRVRQFVADASHELRTPLASIRGYAELTRREREPVPAGVTHALARVESEAQRMTALVDDLLLLARLDAGRPLDHGEVDLTELVVHAVSDAHAASPAHQWRLDLPDEPVLVRGDQARLHQIVANLLANARAHTPAGTVVTAGIAREPGRVRLTVNDNGPGVPESLQPNVFQRFARGDSSRNRAAGSTGLGLSIVAAVAGAHGGSVELTSRAGDTTFTVVLPAPDGGSGQAQWAGRLGDPASA